MATVINPASKTPEPIREVRLQKTFKRDTKGKMVEVREMRKYAFYEDNDEHFSLNEWQMQEFTKGFLRGDFK